MKIFLKLKLFTALLLIGNIILPFGWSLEDDVMEVETMAEQLFFITVRIKTVFMDNDGNLKKGVGTGFLVRYKWSEKKQADFLVTNKHVIEKATEGRLVFTKAENGQPVLGEIYTIDVDNFEKAWFKNSDEQIDVAVMSMGRILTEAKRRGWTFYYKTLFKEMSLDNIKLEKLNALEEVVFVGYPNGLYDVKNNLPIIRRGITATPLSIDYEGSPRFLIDASVFNGSSGSPVFIYNAGSYSLREDGLVAGSRVIFLGIISEVFVRTETGELKFVKIPTALKPIVEYKEKIDIGVVYKASTVFETIREYLETIGQIE